MKTKLVLPTSPTYSGELSALARVFDRVLRELHAEAKRDACKGDLWVGWDWPTLAMVKPEVYAFLMACKARARECKIALHSAGLIA